MYKIFEKIENNVYHLRYETDDLQLACDVLNAFKSKYLDRNFYIFDLIS